MLRLRGLLVSGASKTRLEKDIGLAGALGKEWSSKI